MTIQRSKYLSTEEVQRLCVSTEARAALDLKQGRRQWATIWMAVDFYLQTGLRGCEAATITLEGIDLKRGILHVLRAKKRGQQSYDEIAIPPDLRKHLAEYIAWRQLVGYPSVREAPLFWGQRGGLSSKGLRDMWNLAIKEAGLPHIPAHGARHTLAVHLLRKTKNLRQVQKQLGHSRADTTAAFYADVPFEDQMEGLTDLYGPSMEGLTDLYGPTKEGQ
jgi:integrase